MTATWAAAERAVALRRADVPESVLLRLKTTLLHDLSVAIAGHRLADTAITLARSLGPGACRLLVDGSAVTADAAVLANAAQMHARTQDDTHLGAQTHLGSTVLPALLAVGEERDADGSAFLRAMLAAYETAELAAGSAEAVTARGFRASTVFGPLAAAAGVSSLLDLDTAGTANALGLAAGFGAGTGQTWVAGTEEWQYQLGVAGRNGMLAARLAALGVVAAPDALEGSAGLYRAVTGTTDPGGSATELQWQSLAVTYKPFPVCAINQLPVELAARMVAGLGIDASRIEAVELVLPPSHADYPGTRSWAPFSGVGAALMSAPHCLALAFLDGTVTRASLERLDDPRVAALAARVRVESDPQLVPGECLIRVVVDGVTRTSDEVPAPGSFSWGWDETLERSVALSDEMPLSESRVRELAGAVLDLEGHRVADLVSATLP